MSPLDLHVLSTPPAFVLSQDQTLLFNPVYIHTLSGWMSLIGITVSLIARHLFRWLCSVSFSRFTLCSHETACVSYHFFHLVSSTFFRFFFSSICTNILQLNSAMMFSWALFISVSFSFPFCLKNAPSVSWLKETERNCTYHFMLFLSVYSVSCNSVAVDLCCQ